MADPKLIYQLNAINTLQIGQLVYLDLNDNEYKPAIASSLQASFARGYVTGFFGNDKFYLQSDISFASYNDPLPDSWYNYYPATSIVNPLDVKITKVPGNVGDALYVSESISGSFQSTIPSGNVSLVGYKTLGGFMFRPSLDSRLFAPITSLKTEADCATTTNITLSGEQTIDGIATNNSRVLVKDQTNKVQNGLYTSSIGTWVRSDDGDYGTDLDYCNVFVEGGSTQSGIWVSTGYGYLIGVSEINFIRISTSSGGSSNTQVISGNYTPLPTTAAISGFLQSEILAISGVNSNQAIQIAAISAASSSTAGLSGIYTTLSTTAAISAGLQSQINTFNISGNGGSSATNIITNNTNITTSYKIVFCDASTISFPSLIVGLPSPNLGTSFYIKKIDSSPKTVKISGSAYIDNYPTFIISNENECINIAGDGSKWRIIGHV